MTPPLRCRRPGPAAGCTVPCRPKRSSWIDLPVCRPRPSPRARLDACLNRRSRARDSTLFPRSPRRAASRMRPDVLGSSTAFSEPLGAHPPPLPLAVPAPLFRASPGWFAGGPPGGAGGGRRTGGRSVDERGGWEGGGSHDANAVEQPCPADGGAGCAPATACACGGSAGPADAGPGSPRLCCRRRCRRGGWGGGWVGGGRSGPRPRDPFSASLHVLPPLRRFVQKASAGSLC